MTERRPNLTTFERAWADAWRRHGNATLAARQAGYKGNANVLAVQGARNKNNPAIQAYLRQSFVENAASREEVISVLSDITRSSLELALHPVDPNDPNSRLTLDLREAQALGALGQIKEVKEVHGRHGPVITVKLHDKVKAAALLAQIEGWIGAETTDASDLPDEDPRDLARRHLGPDVDEDLLPPPTPDDEGAA